jgi:hypothetical protein
MSSKEKHQILYRWGNSVSTRLPEEVAANGGFVVSIADDRFGYNRREIQIPEDGADMSLSDRMLALALDKESKGDTLTARDIMAIAAQIELS